MSNFDDIFEPAPQAEDFDKEAWAAKKKAERDERYATADATAEEICTDGGKFRDYLDVQAKFHRYSATNALLILHDNKNASKLGDKDFWRDQGVYIKRQEFGRPIKIVESNGEYTRDDGSIGVSYNIKRVYDISQTTARTRAPQAVSHDARALLNALIYKRPAPVQSVDELPNGMDAVYDREQNTVLSDVGFRQTTCSAVCPRRWCRRSLPGPARNTPRKTPGSRRSAFPISSVKSSA